MRPAEILVQTRLITPAIMYTQWEEKFVSLIEEEVMFVELIPLATARITLREPLILEGTPMSTRMIFEVSDAEFFGDRLAGKLKGHAAADWLLVGPNNVGTLDIRATLETHDGALIYSAYKGRTDLSTAVHQFMLRLFMKPGTSAISGSARFSA
ncbi:MAG: hypothetical protein CMQ19_14840 [Gammaproteobacteria bacterium]|nr:hypothetical protein [Gammaproteobacteria bacterium]